MPALMSALILIVEDEPDLVQTLQYNLRKEGWATRSAATGRQALEQAQLSPLPDLILLDLMLPDLSGIEVCRQLKRDERLAAVPVLMLTARGEEIDRVVGFEVGADDYVVKPFSVRELMLRVRALLRRTRDDAGGASPRVSFGRLKLDEAGHRVWVDDEEVILTALEFRLLLAFLARKGRVQSREQLLSEVWGDEARVTARTVDVHVKRLREKLGPVGAYVETVRGVGYRFRDRPEESGGQA